jgi:3'-phosphoadenosine 5'-phosphosulfate sulfotransferase (PAPS reductase)/FAD synthetase
MYGLTWLPKQNIPIVGKPVNSRWKLRNDSWLAGQYERRIFTESLEKQLGVKVDFTDRILVFHRVPSWSRGIEYAVEVYGEGVRLGLLLYSNGSWLVIPSGALASIIESIGGEVIELNITEKYIKNKKLQLDRKLCLSGSKYVLISHREYVGVAKVIDPEKCIVKVKDMAPRGFKLLDKAHSKDLLELNKPIIEEYAGEAMGFIRGVYASYNQHVMPVAFSGGADSTAVLSLAVEALGSDRVIAVYSDTGLEFDETRRYVEEISNRLGVELVVLESGVDVLGEIRKRGLMSVDNRWCTSLLKLNPMRMYYESRSLRVYLDGARDYESTLRAITPRIGENPLVPGVLRALPVKSWPRIVIQLYLLSRGIPLNPLYDKGYTRIGCIICPAMHRFELLLSYSEYKRIHEDFMNVSGLDPDEYFSMKWSKRRIFTE